MNFLVSKVQTRVLRCRQGSWAESTKSIRRGGGWWCSGSRVQPHPGQPSEEPTPRAQDQHNGTRDKHRSRPIPYPQLAPRDHPPGKKGPGFLRIYKILPGPTELFQAGGNSVSRTTSVMGLSINKSGCQGMGPPFIRANGHYYTFTAWSHYSKDPTCVNSILPAIPRGKGCATCLRARKHRHKRSYGFLQ